MKTSLFGWAGAVILFLAAGCADDTEKFGREMGRVRATEPPTFLNGDLAQFFGQANFSARAAVQKGLPGTRPPMTGELSGLNGSLFFMADEQRLRRGMAGGLSALWDAAAQTAYLLNEPLQGYAPIRPGATNGPLEVTVVGEEDLNGERTRKSIAGHRVAGEMVPQWIVWRSPAQQDLPVRIQTTNTPGNVTLTLSRIRLAAPPADLFVLPNGFKKYDSTEAMMSELVARGSSRLQGVRRGKGADWQLEPDESYGPRFQRPGSPPN